MYGLGMDERMWEVANPYGQGIYGSIAWTGEHVIGIARQFTGTGGGSRYWGYLTAWDPASGTWHDLPQPPSTVADANIVWTGERAVLLGEGLAFDPASGEWWILGSAVGAGMPRRGAVTLWAGDRLFVWGGQKGGEAPEMYPRGYTILPQW
jgi:hypothetical protein